MIFRRHAVWLLLAALVITALAYWPGLSGSWLFDDYPNIVDNPGVQPHAAGVASLVRAALSSPASEFKRPLASLSFAANYLVGGLDPWSWKLFNLLLHLLNGVLVFVLARMLLQATPAGAHSQAMPSAGIRNWGFNSIAREQAPTMAVATTEQRAGTVAALIAGGWMLLPINLTAVLYVVQREESLANLFVLLGLIGYVAGRRRMLHAQPTSPSHPRPAGRGGFGLCVASLVLCTTIGLLAKETAVMLPLYAFLAEAIVFGGDTKRRAQARSWWDGRLLGLFAVVLLLPLLLGLYWLLPQVLAPSQWATRDFTLGTRLLTEARVICGYIAWTLLPAPGALSFYHDQFPPSIGLLSPWTTLAAIGVLAALAWLAMRWRKRHPMVALGLAWFLGGQLLTGTLLPLELVYEHRNYFASLGLMLALVPWLAGWQEQATISWRWPRRIILAALLLWWGTLTTLTAYAWGDPLRLAQELAARAPDSPRAQYELGRTYIIYSHYDPASPYTALAYAPLEQAAALPQSSILPQQALIFMNARMGRPLKAAWWDSIIAKLKARPPGVQDESSLGALVHCAHDGACPLPQDRMVAAFEAALAHPHPSARLQASYGDYAWNVLDDHALGLRMTAAAAAGQPAEPAYHITLTRMLAAQGRYAEAEQQIAALQRLNIGGRLNHSIAELRAMLPPAP